MKLSKVNESGRSMVEMLGVLAIIGVLSVMGIAGYNVAMTSHKANETISQAMRLAMIVSGQKLLGHSNVTLSDDDVKGIYSFDKTVTSEGTKFTLKAKSVAPAVRKKIEGMELKAAEVTVSGDDVTFTFDLNDGSGEDETSKNCWQRGNCKETDAGLYEEWCDGGLHRSSYCQCITFKTKDECVHEESPYKLCRENGNSAGCCECLIAFANNESQCKQAGEGCENETIVSGNYESTPYVPPPCSNGKYKIEGSGLIKVCQNGEWKNYQENSWSTVTCNTTRLVDYDTEVDSVDEICIVREWY